MKKIIALLMVTVLICSAFTACVPKEPTDNTTKAPSEEIITTEPEEASTLPQPTNPVTKLPEYVPGSIKLEPQESDDYNFERKYRITYYRIWGEWLELLDDEQTKDCDEWFDRNSKETHFGEFQNEMLLVAFVKRYNIPREKFDEAAKKFAAGLKESDAILEECEVPNADIIYTFDNEIINRYYRYE